MAVVARRVNVGTTPVRLDSATSSDARDGKVVTIRNSSISTPCYLGPDTVSASTGYSLGASEVLARIPLNAGDILYAVTATGSATVHVLEVGV